MGLDAEQDPGEIFDELRKLLPNLRDPVGAPEQFVRDVHQAWKEAGGLLSGKPRHSDRFLDDRLRAKVMPVKSLTPKLVGRTRIRAEDADHLLRFFLANWPQAVEGGATEAEGIKYKALLAAGEIEDIVSFIVVHIDISPESNFAENLDQGAQPNPGPPPLPGRDVSELIPSLFAESDAFFSVATERATISQSDKSVLVSFRDLMNALQVTEAYDERERPLIWVIDIGRRMFEDVGARLRYIGFNRLQMRFKALREFDDRKREDRWNWLLSRSAFVVKDTRFDELVDMRGVKRPAFAAHHVSFTAIPDTWASSPNFRTLYGRELEDLDQRSFSVFFNSQGWQYDDGDEEGTRHCRYFGYAAFTKDQNTSTDKIPRGLELPYSGYNHEDAYLTVYAAATDLLRLPNRLARISRVNGKQATAQLNHLGFRLMGLDDFMTL